MAQTFYIGEDDLLPIVSATLYDGAGVVDLTGASVAFQMTPPSGSIKVNAACAVVSATAGTVTYTWAGTDTDTPGVFEANFIVTFASTKKESFPNDSFLRVVVRRKIS